jgi:DNA replication protein DnaC
MDSFSKTFTSQITQLINIYLTKNVNFGDRTIDNAIIILFNAFISMMMFIIYNLFEKLYNCYNDYYYNDGSLTSTVNIKNFDFTKYTKEDIQKYIFSTKIFDDTNYGASMRMRRNILTYDKFIYWLSHNFESYNAKNNTPIIFYNKNNNVELLLEGSNENNNINNIFMPIWKYKNGHNIEYVWLCDSSLYSKNLNALQKCVEDVTKNSNSTIKVELTKHVYELQTISRCNINGSISKEISLLEIGNVNTKKTIDKLFFNNKELLIETMDKLKLNKLYPEKLSLDNKLGILLHGPPGSGKTGLCSAIANYFDRHIIIINSMTNIGLKLKFIPQYYKTHVIVFDEFDYVLAKKDKGLSLQEILDTENKEEKKLLLAKYNEEKDNDDTMLMLQFLDGIEDAEDRVVIATTNFVDRINKYFIRPGRFDLNLEIGYCNQSVFAEIIQTVYPDYIFDESNYVTDITPLILINALVTTNSLENLFNKISKTN